MSISMNKVTSKNGKLVAYIEQSIRHQPYYIVYIDKLSIPIAYIIKNDSCIDWYDLPLDNTTRLRIGDPNVYLDDIISLLEIIKE